LKVADMIEGWSKTIEAVQSQTDYRIGRNRLDRIRYGDEADDWEPTSDPATTAPSSKVNSTSPVAT
jgi:hypothetical protein